MFAHLTKPTPLFNREEIYTSLQTFDKSYLIRSLEMILFPGSLCKIIEQKGSILKILTPDYPSDRPLFIDARFATIEENAREPVTRLPPSSKELLHRLTNYPKRPYIWGGNIAAGVPEMLHYYPPPRLLTPYEYASWQFKGVDCSGLLYEVSSGFLPRNALSMRAALPTVPSLRPFDLITVIHGPHVLIALPGEKVLESREYDGIVLSPLSTRLKELAHREPLFHRWL